MPSRLALALATVAVALLLVACGGGGDDDEAATPTTASPTTATRSTPEASAVTRIELPSPDWLAADEDWVYVKRDGGVVDRLDPAAGTVTASVEAGTTPCQGLGAGPDGDVWTCDGPDLVRIDFDAEAVVATFPVGKTASQGTLAVTAGVVWVLTGDGSTLQGVDVETGEAVHTVALDGRGSDLAADGTTVWVVSGPDDVVMAVDIATATVRWQADVAADHLALADDGVLWAGGRTTTLLDADRGTAVGTLELGPGGTGGLAADGGSVWVRSEDRFLQLVEADGRVRRSLEEDVTSGGDVLVAHGAVWATAFDDGALFRIA